jgi:hypothetical protein
VKCVDRLVSYSGLRKLTVKAGSFFYRIATYIAVASRVIIFFGGSWGI